MGRKAGVSAEETREALLTASARVFSAKGYDGASIADISRESGLSSGALYAHYSSKADLFAAVLSSRAGQQYLDLITNSNIRDVAEFITVIGSSYDKRQKDEAALLLEAMVASKRDPEVARIVGGWAQDAETLLTAAIRAAQDDGIVSSDVKPESISRLALMVALGSFLTSALELPDTDHDGWTDLIGRVVDAVRVKP